MECHKGFERCSFEECFFLTETTICWHEFFVAVPSLTSGVFQQTTGWKIIRFVRIALLIQENFRNAKT